MKIHFVSSNIDKFLEIKSIVKNRLNCDLEFCKVSLVEIQSIKIEEIAIEKSRAAFKKIRKPVIIEDDGLFINSLNGFPGQYSSYILSTIGNRGILNLLKTNNDRTAFFKALIVYNDGKSIKLFSGKINGKISLKITKGGWGFDPIFIPKNLQLSLGELALNGRKDDYSHRRAAVEKFIKWHCQIKNQIRKS